MMKKACALIAFGTAAVAIPGNGDSTMILCVSALDRESGLIEQSSNAIISRCLNGSLNSSRRRPFEILLELYLWFQAGAAKRKNQLTRPSNDDIIINIRRVL